MPKHMMNFWKFIKNQRKIVQTYSNSSLKSYFEDRISGIYAWGTRLEFLTIHVAQSIHGSIHRVDSWKIFNRGRFKVDSFWDSLKSLWRVDSQKRSIHTVQSIQCVGSIHGVDSWRRFTEKSVSQTWVVQGRFTRCWRANVDELCRGVLWWKPQG